MLDDGRNVWHFGESLLEALQKALETKNEDLKHLGEEFAEEYSFRDWEFWPVTFTTYEKIRRYDEIRKHPWEKLECEILDGHAELKRVMLDGYEGVEDCTDRYREILEGEGFHCEKQKSCEDCGAFESKRFSRNGCGLGFATKKTSRGRVIPLEECPNPLTPYDFKRCVKYKR